MPTGTRGWIQVKTPDGPKLVPKEEYQGNNVRGPSQQVIGDMQPFVSPVTGEVISSRPQLREHNRTHNVTNSSDYGKDFKWVENRRKEIETQQSRTAKAERIEALKRATQRR